MKTSLTISFIILFFIFSSYAQDDVLFPASIVAAGGGEGNGNKGHISKWRIGQINVLHIKSKDLKNSILTSAERINSIFYQDWEILVYPNPVTDILKVKFEINNPEFLEINVTDITGRKIIERKIQQIIPNETIELDFNGFSSALYFVNIWSKNKRLFKSVKISKQ